MPHHKFGKLRVASQHPAELIPTDQDHFSRFNAASSHQRAAIGEHVDLAGKLASTVLDDRDQTITTVDFDRKLATEDADKVRLLGTDIKDDSIGFDRPCLAVVRCFLRAERASGYGDQFELGRRPLEPRSRSD